MDRSLAEAFAIITETAHPEKLILFGSRARGTQSESSDYDILLIHSDEENGRELSRRVYRELLARGVPLDIQIVAVSRSTWECHRDTDGYVYKTAAEEGVVLYSAYPQGLARLSGKQLGPCEGPTRRDGLTMISASRLSRLPKRP